MATAAARTIDGAQSVAGHRRRSALASAARAGRCRRSPPTHAPKHFTRAATSRLGNARRGGGSVSYRSGGSVNGAIGLRPTAATAADGEGAGGENDEERMIGDDVDETTTSRSGASDPSGAVASASPLAVQPQLADRPGSPHQPSASSRVVEFVAAWDALSPRLAGGSSGGLGGVAGGSVRTDGIGGAAVDGGGGNREMLLSALKLAIPRLQMISSSSAATGDPDANERPIHERAVEVTLALVDLGMDAECMSAGLLREALVAGTVTLEEIESHLGPGVMRLAHDCQRLHALPRRVGSYDDATAEKLRTFCLTFHDVRAIVVELAYRVDALRHARSNPALTGMGRSAMALETMQLYAPMAHALDAGPLCAELEDLSLQELFPSSYRSLEQWLRGEGPADRSALERAREWLTEALIADPGLMTLIGGPAGVSVKARRKSLFSTMRKVLRDGRAREDVHDLLGMRVIITPQPGSPSCADAAAGEPSEADVAAAERSAMAACYRAQQIAHGVFDVVPGRTKDYLQRPKANGYRSLHSTLRLPEEWTTRDGGVNNGGGEMNFSDEDDRSRTEDLGPRRVELQVRTAAMHAAAEMGAAAHAAYKGGFKEDPGAADALAELVTAANAAAEQRFGSFTEAGLSSSASDPVADRMFRMFDLDGDGRVTREELRTVISNLWDDENGGEDGAGVGVRDAADELVAMLDADEDGVLSPEEFARFRSSINVLGSLSGADAATAAAIEGKFASLVEPRRLDDDDDEGSDPFAALEDGAGARPSEKDAAGAVTAADITGADDSNSDAPATWHHENESEASEASDAAAAAAAAAAAMAAPPLPPSAPAGRVRPAEDTLRDASRALRDKSGGAVEWQLVWDLMRAGRPETARELFYQRTSRTPGVTGLWEQWARFELLQGDVERARGLYRAALLHAEGRPRARAESLRKWAIMEFGAGQRESAGGLFERALRVLEEAEEAAAAAEEVEGVEHLGGSGSDDYDYDGFDFDEGLENAPDDGSYSANAIVTPRTEKGEAESAASLRAAQAVVLHAWAQAEARAGAIGAARELLTKALDRDADSPFVAHALAQLDEAAGDFESARVRYAKASLAHPRDRHVALSRARLEWKVFGDAESARRVFRDVADPDYRLLQAWGVMESATSRPRGRTADRNEGDVAKGLAAARPLFSRAADMAPWSPQVWSAWAHAEWSAGTAPERVRELYAAGLDADPTNSACLVGLGRVERVTGRLLKARDYLERAHDLEPENARALKELAKVEEASGNKGRAARYFNASRELKLKGGSRLGKTADADGEHRERVMGTGSTEGRGRSGTWAPASAAAAARGRGAIADPRVRSGASYSYVRRSDAVGGDAGGGASRFMSVLAAARGEAAVARRDVRRGGPRGGAVVRRRSTWRARGGDEGQVGRKGEGPGAAVGSVGMAAGKKIDTGGRIGSSIDAPGSSLDAPGSSLDAVAHADVDEVSYVSAYDSSDDGWSSADEELRRYTSE